MEQLDRKIKTPNVYEVTSLEGTHTVINGLSGQILIAIRLSSKSAITGALSFSVRETKGPFANGTKKGSSLPVLRFEVLEKQYKIISNNKSTFKTD